MAQHEARIVGEDMPQEGNRVTLNTDELDDHGLPVPNVHFDDHPNDVAMRNHGYQQASLLYESVGATSVHHTPPYPSTHNMGTARMSERPEDGVVNRFGQAHDVPLPYAPALEDFVLPQTADLVRAARHLEGDARLRERPLGARDALRDCGLRREEGARDLCGR